MLGIRIVAVVIRPILFLNVRRRGKHYRRRFRIIKLLSKIGIVNYSNKAQNSRRG